MWSLQGWGKGTEELGLLGVTVECSLSLTCWAAGSWVRITWCVCLVAQSCLTPCRHMDCSPPGSSVHEFSRQDYWSRLPFPAPRDIPQWGFEPTDRQILYHCTTWETHGFHYWCINRSSIMKSCLQSRDTGPGKHSRISYSLHVTVNDWRELGTWPPVPPPSSPVSGTGCSQSFTAFVGRGETYWLVPPPLLSLSLWQAGTWERGTEEQGFL